jgi:hypothetical protein
MRPSPALYKQVVRLTFFTRPQCSLCDDAKAVLSKVWDRRPFEYGEVNIAEPQHKKWKIYKFDIPVVSTQWINALNQVLIKEVQIHFDATEENNHHFETKSSARKLMHRITEQEVDAAMDDALKAGQSGI